MLEAKTHAGASPGRMETPENGNSHGHLHQGHHLHHLQFVESQQHHVPWSASLAPRRRVFYDPSKHGYLVQWSRQLRKNRDPEFIPDDKYWKDAVVVPKLPVLFKWDFKNISWQVAVWFTLGSICWIVNGQYFMWPKQGDASLEVNVHITGYSALVGGLLFWIGAYLAILEAINQRSGDAVLHQLKARHLLEKLKEEPRDIQRFVHRHLLKKAGVGVAALDPEESRVGAYEVKCSEDDSESSTDSSSIVMPLRSRWRWIGIDMSTLGWWAAAIQFGGATCFTVAVISGTPGVLKGDQWQLQVALIWSMQIVGSIGFIVSSLLLMLEEQAKWYLPALDLIGWHSAFWNLVGAIGFLLSAVFGLLANWRGQGEVCCQFWGTGFNTYYGSWAFLIASLLTLIEVQNKQPTSLGIHITRFYVWLAEKTGMESPGLLGEKELEHKNNSKEEV